MNSSSATAPAMQHISPVVAPAIQCADRTYQSVTIVAMLLLLASLCLFR